MEDINIKRHIEDKTIVKIIVIPGKLVNVVVNRLWAVLLTALVLLPACGYQLTAQAPIILPEGNTRLFLSKGDQPVYRDMA